MATAGDEQMVCNKKERAEARAAVDTQSCTFSGFLQRNAKALFGDAQPMQFLRAIASGEGPRDHLIALGYAGWAPGQLEDELGANSWLSGPADGGILFRLPDEARWLAAAQLLGVDLNLLSAEAGHA
jgi:putative AlgH/UPF0301 family transcriptional regulator